MMMQVGVVFAPIIATRKFFVWNNIAFINNLQYGKDDDEGRQTGMVLSAIPIAVSQTLANDLGARALGEVFEYICKTEDETNYSMYLNLVCLLRAKPAGWRDAVQMKIEKTSRNALYLRYILSSCMRQFSQEVNTGGDRSALKTLVGAIQAKRHFKKEKPSEKMIQSTIKAMDRSDFLDEKPHISSAEPERAEE